MEDKIKNYFQRDVMEELSQIFRAKDYKHAMEILDNMLYLADRIEKETILSYYKGSYFEVNIRKLRNDIYYSILGFERGIEYDE